MVNSGHAVDGVLHFVHVEDVFQQFHDLGDLQVFDCRCATFQSSCHSAKTVGALFAVSVLVILDAVFQTLDSVVKLFDLLFVFLFFFSQLFKLLVGCVFHRYLLCENSKTACVATDGLGCKCTF